MFVDSFGLASFEILSARSQVHSMDSNVDDTLLGNFRCPCAKLDDTLQIFLEGRIPLL